MENPTFIQFHNGSLKILVGDLLAVSPEEGCALLIGDYCKEGKGKNSAQNIWRVYFVWPCCNVFGRDHFANKDFFVQSSDHQVSDSCSKNRFLLDPFEQIHAQKWSREKSLKVLGTAHSHPTSDPIPSLIDLDLAPSEGLMVICDKRANLRAWWISNNREFSPKELEYLDCS
tara:strand:+ start:1268 stop:1783 length:516 start_codon:yes stop_codon:yes gene_type:complete